MEEPYVAAVDAQPEKAENGGANSSNTISKEDFGKSLYGCDHYRRRCKLRAPCCNQIFTCRHCHNEATSALSNPKERHEIVRHDVKKVICAVCDTEQQVSNLCSKCGVKFGEYFCNICNFYDDDASKEQFHCNDCGICRVGGRENFFHCQKCGSCYSVALRDNHQCVENSMKSHCPICYEFLFDSTKDATIMNCGHTMHTDCYNEMLSQNQYRCPICSKEEAENGGANSSNSISKEDFGKSLYGCDHYRRRCKLWAPCCNQIFTCRHCHNEATSALSNPKERHEIVRHDVKKVICAVCDTEQQVSNLCSKCGVKFGEYFCNICNFYDDDASKEQFHCNDCGICRVGGRENFFHCQKCGSCYSVALRDNHQCVENSMKSHCPICYEFLFDSTKDATIMNCGHTMHTDCYNEMLSQNQYRCPICSKSVLNMSRTWERLDREIEATPMPEEYHYEVVILCNDCNNTGKAFFHIFGHKCRHCKSYNTRVITNGETHQ